MAKPLDTHQIFCLREMAQHGLRKGKGGWSVHGRKPFFTTAMVYGLVRRGLAVIEPDAANDTQAARLLQAGKDALRRLSQ